MVEKSSSKDSQSVQDYRTWRKYLPVHKHAIWHCALLTLLIHLLSTVNCATQWLVIESTLFMLVMWQCVWLLARTMQIYLQRMTDNFSIFALSVLLHNSGFCNDCITKRRLHISTNVSYKILFHDCSMIKDENNTNLIFFVIFWMDSSQLLSYFAIQPLQNPPLCNSTAWSCTVCTCAWREH